MDNNSAQEINQEFNTKNNKDLPKPENLTAYQAAEILRVSPTTIRRLEAQGKLTAIREEHGYRHFSKQEVETLKQTLEKEKVQRKIPQIKQVPVETKYKKNLFKQIIIPTYIVLTILTIIGVPLVNKSYIQGINSNGAAYKSNNSQTKIQNDNILGIRDRITDFVYNINIPTNIKNTLNVEGVLSTTELAFQNVGRITGLQDVDIITKNTLERLLDVNGDIIGTGLGNVRLADRVVLPQHLSDELAYGGSWDFSGTWAIDSVEVTITGNQLNTLGENTEALVSLVDVADNLVNISDSEVASGGIAFGDGTKYIQNTNSLFWDNVNNRLGIPEF